MAGSLNKVILVGNLGKDPEIRHTNDGARIANLSLATNESWKDKATGERRDRTEWHRVVIFNENLAEIAEKYLENDENQLFRTLKLCTSHLQKNGTLILSWPEKTELPQIQNLKLTKSKIYAGAKLGWYN